MDWKDKLKAISSDIPQVEAESDKAPQPEPHPKRNQTLRIELDKRNGKPATLITGFEGSADELKELAKTLKARCAAGGSQRDGEILVQGDFRKKIAAVLQELGYKTKLV